MTGQAAGQTKSPGLQPRIGDRLTQLLDERFLTQRELAIALDIHERQITRWTLNQTGPRRVMLRRIAEYFGVAPGDLLNSSPEREAA